MDIKISGDFAENPGVAVNDTQYRPVRTKLTTGDTVKSSKGNLGTVVAFKGGRVGVAFRGAQNGHDLDGALPSGSTEGYWYIVSPDAERTDTTASLTVLR